MHPVDTIVITQLASINTTPFVDFVANDHVAPTRRPLSLHLCAGVCRFDSHIFAAYVAMPMCLSSYVAIPVKRIPSHYSCSWMTSC